jgi:importin-9
VSGLLRALDDEKLISHDVEPPQFTRVPFPVKALKLLLHELQTNGEAASMAAPTAPLDAGFDDGDSDWSDEEKVKDDRYAFLADVIGVGGISFDEDEILANNDDEDLQKDPVSQIDLRVSWHEMFDLSPDPNLSDLHVS